MKISAKQRLCVNPSITRTVIFIFVFTSVLLAQSEWNQLNPPNTPSARQGHSMVALPDGKVALFGGEGPQEDLFNDLYIFQENDWEEQNPAGDKPAARKNAASWVGENKMYIHGGEGAEGVILEDMWIYDLYVNQWEEVVLGQNNPGPLTRHSAAPFDDGKVLITSGKSSENTSSFKTYLYDPATNSFEQKQDIPFPTSEQSTMAVGDEAFPAQVFGENQDMVAYNRTSDLWSAFMPDQGSEHPGLMASATYCNALDQGLYVIGGEEYHDGVGYENTKSAWKFDPNNKSWSWISELPIFLLHASAVYDQVNDRLVLFGGKDENGDLINDTYEYQFNPTNVDSDVELITEFNLEQNYPNPFNPTTTINFTVPSDIRGETQDVRLVVYNSLGQKAATLINESKSPGFYEVQFDASNFSSGIYFYKLTVGNLSQTNKMVVVK